MPGGNAPNAAVGDSPPRRGEWGIYPATSGHNARSVLPSNVFGPENTRMVVLTQPGRNEDMGNVEIIDRLLRPAEAARLLGVSPRCLKDWRRDGRNLPFVRLTARAIRYRTKDVIRFIESCKVGGN